MKKIILFLCVVVLFLTACDKSGKADIPIPPVVPPGRQTVTIDTAQLICNNDLAWLKEIIKKGDEDLATKKYGGRYRGRIFLYAYNSTPLFFVEMSMGSNLAPGFIYDCSGSYYTIPGNGWGTWMSEAQEKGKLLYTNVSY